MALTTYLSRILGYLLLRGRKLTPRLHAVLDTVPGCVLIAVIAPAWVSPHPADLLALGLTLLAAMRWSLLPTVLIGILSAGALRHVLPG